MKDARDREPSRRVFHSLLFAAASVFGFGSIPLAAQTVDAALTNLIPAAAAVGVATTVTVQASAAGETGVTITAIFTPAVTFNSSGSSAGCSSNSSSDPSTTVTCPWSGSDVTIGFTPVSSTTINLVAGVIGNENDPNMTNNSRSTTIAVGGPPPGSFIATQTSNTEITAQWSAPAGGADFYEVSRATAVGGPYTVLTPNPTTTTFVDGSGAQGQTYLYRVRASKGGLWSGYSAPDPATLFTDYALAQYVTVIQAAHINELRVAVDMRRALASLGPGAWSPTINPGATIVQRGDIQQLRDLLDQAMGPGSYTDQPLARYQAGAIVIKKQHIQEIRNRVQ